MVITDKEQEIIWNTGTLKAWSTLNYNKILYPQNIEGKETYIVVGEDKRHIEGFELHKQHQEDKHVTRYFVRTQDIKEIPFIVRDTAKVHSKGNVYHLVVEFEPVSIPIKKVFDWKQIIDYSGIPTHSNKTHYTLYKIKVLYGRIKPQVYYRTITESAFGKDKYKESVRLLLNECSLLSDPSIANLFYRACHNREITINELPDTKNKSDFIKLCNMLIRLGDGTKTLDNRARATTGTIDTADTSMLSLSFTHNVPSYYHDKGEKCFDDIYPYNVINRFYYNLYDGYGQGTFPSNLDFEKLAKKHDLFIKNWISSALSYSDIFSKEGNKFKHIPLFDFRFSPNEERFKSHFEDYAVALSHYALNEKEYLELLHEEYKSHKEYEKMLTDFVPASEYKNQEVLI